MLSQALILLALIVFNGNCLKIDLLDHKINCRNEDLLNLPNLGKLKGNEGQTAWTNQTYIQFLGIPFAKPPVGPLRFKKPEPHPGWEGTLNATVYGRRCPVYDIALKLPKYLQANHILEDCLFLNVFTKCINDKRPVMVYIHGGALCNGTASENRPDFLLEKDIVLVTIQYRLSALGFLSTRTKDIPGNAGLMDVVLALKWVQQNIKYFGGDSNSVTVFGESSGACLIGLLAISPHVTCDLFQRAIMQSGNTIMDVINQLDPLKSARQTCTNLNCEKCDKIDDVNQCLKSANAVDLLVAGAPLGIVPFGFSPDDFYGNYPISPKDAILQRPNCFQYMAGVTKHEGGFTTSAGGNQTIPKLYYQAMVDSFNEPDPYGTLQIVTEGSYFEDGILNKRQLPDLAPQFVDMGGDWLFKISFLEYNDLYMKNCSSKKFCTKSKCSMQNYLYSYEYSGEYWWKPYLEQFIPEMKKRFHYNYPYNKCKVFHADDLLTLFPTEPLNKNDLRQAKMMVDLWTSFAITGQPETTYSQTKIPPAESSRGPYFKITDKITIENDIIDVLRAASKAFKSFNCESDKPNKCCKPS